MGFNFSSFHSTGSIGSSSDFREVSIILQDRKGSGVDGGSFSSVGGFKTRDLNTIVNDGTGQVILSSNQFTLPAGSYLIRARAPAYRVNTHSTRLRNITDSSTTLEGVASFAPDPVGSTVLDMSDSWVVGAFTIAAAKTFELQHSCDATHNTDGFGQSTGFNAESVYTTVELLKVA